MTWCNFLSIIPSHNSTQFRVKPRSHDRCQSSNRWTVYTRKHAVFFWSHTPRSRSLQSNYVLQKHHHELMRIVHIMFLSLFIPSNNLTATTTSAGVANAPHSTVGLQARPGSPQPKSCAFIGCSSATCTETLSHGSREPTCKCRGAAGLPLIWGFCPGALKTVRKRKIV